MSLGVGLRRWRQVEPLKMQEKLSKSGCFCTKRNDGNKDREELKILDTLDSEPTFDKKLRSS